MGNDAKMLAGILENHAPKSCGIPAHALQEFGELAANEFHKIDPNQSRDNEKGGRS